jgi:uncharacterized protein YndB with AHSA1/START domain
MKIIQNTIVIAAPLQRVWDTLTKGEETRKYMFGCETISDWNVGSELNWKGTHEGQEMIFVTGIIKEISPLNKLVYTTFDPFSSMENILENHLDVTYQLEEVPEGVLFTVTQGDYDSVAEGARRYEEAYNNGLGWSPILTEIKKVAENN